MRLEDVSEVEVRELKAQMGRVNSENRGLGAKMASQKEQSECSVLYIAFFPCFWCVCIIFGRPGKETVVYML